MPATVAAEKKRATRFDCSLHLYQRETKYIIPGKGPASLRPRKLRALREMNIHLPQHAPRASVVPPVPPVLNVVIYALHGHVVPVVCSERTAAVVKMHALFGLLVEQ